MSMNDVGEEASKDSKTNEKDGKGRKERKKN